MFECLSLAGLPSKCLWLRPGANLLVEHLKELCVSATKTINKKIVNIVKIVKNAPKVL
jgi:hypothetical protein